MPMPSRSRTGLRFPSAATTYFARTVLSVPLSASRTIADVDLNLLVALDALLAERSVTRAAERVGLSQPGMSNTLARLRKLFGDPLLVREGLALVPTPRAESLRQPVADALSLIQQALDNRPG